MAGLTLTTLTIKLPESQIKPCQKRLLGLPREIRELIYEFSLVELPRWSKTHDNSCRFKSRNSSTLEPPPFILSRSRARNWPKGTIQIPKSPCDCSKRKALGLLLVSRQVHEETAPLFWAKNAFCFDNALEFLEFVGLRLRTEYRKMLRHVSVMGGNFWNVSTQSFWSRSQSSLEWKKFWKMVNQCKDLRTLEVCPEYVRSYHQEISSLTTALPHLERLDIAHLAIYKYKVCGTDYAIGPPCMEDVEDQKTTFYVRSTYPVPMDACMDAEENEQLFRNFTTNFCVHVNTIVKTQFLGIPWRRLHDIEAFETAQFARGLDDSSSTRTVKLPTGKKTELVFYGLPAGPKTRYEMSRKRQTEWSSLKALGRLTPEERETRNMIRSRRREKMESKTKEKQDTYMATLASRLHKRLWLDRENIQAAKEELERTIRRSTDENAEQRRLGRKRVPRQL